MVATKNHGASAWMAVAVVATAMWALAGCEVWQDSDDGGVKITPPPKVEPNVVPPESPIAEQSAVDFFEEGKIHEVRIWMSDEDFTSIIQDTRGDELRSATFSINGTVMANVGIRPSGESSRVPGNQKMSMRIEFAGFDKGKRMGGFDEIKVSGSWDDPFIVRDRLAYWLYRQVMPAPREVPAQVWINGQPRGIFEIEEIWGKEALMSRFADPNGPLYRLRGLTNTDPYAYYGTDTTKYVPLPWDPKGKTDPATEDTLIANALRVVNEEPARLGDVMDVDMLLTYFAVSAIASNTDGFTGPFEVDDHYQYYDPQTGKFVILPWDPDNTFGSINDLPDADIYLNYERCILTRMVRDGILHDAYLTKLEDVMNRVPARAVKEQADAIFNEISSAAANDTTKMYPTDSFVWSLTYIKDWTDKRYASIRSQIAAQRTPTDPTGTPTDAGTPPMDPTGTPMDPATTPADGGTP
jgi:spore coat protein CotH